MTGSISRTCRRVARYRDCVVGLAAAMVLLASVTDGQSAPDSANTLPLKASRTISFTTDEGTWTSLDVSPDGRTVVFDLAGDIWVIPITGGVARRLTSGGLEYNAHPVFSRDGKEIAFISDRSGSDELWLMNADGSGLQPLTKDPQSAASSPEWAPDSEYLVYRRRGAYSAGTEPYPLAMIHRRIRRAFGVSSDQSSLANTSGVSFSSDGRTLYYSGLDRSTFGSIIGQQVFSLDRTTGEKKALTSHYGGGIRPVVSPDGRHLVYATRRDA